MLTLNHTYILFMCHFRVLQKVSVELMEEYQIFAASTAYNVVIKVPSCIIVGLLHVSKFGFDIGHLLLS